MAGLQQPGDQQIGEAPGIHPELLRHGGQQPVFVVLDIRPRDADRLFERPVCDLERHQAEAVHNAVADPLAQALQHIQTRIDLFAACAGRLVGKLPVDQLCRAELGIKRQRYAGVDAVQQREGNDLRQWTSSQSG